MMILSGFLRAVGLTKSIISSLVAPRWQLILTESSLETSCPFTCLIMESPKIIISFFGVEFITPSLLIEFLFSLKFNVETVIIYGLVFPVIWRSTSVDRTTLATLNILNGHMMILMSN